MVKFLKVRDVPQHRPGGSCDDETSATPVSAVDPSPSGLFFSTLGRKIAFAAKPPSGHRR